MLVNLRQCLCNTILQLLRFGLRTISFIVMSFSFTELSNCRASSQRSISSSCRSSSCCCLAANLATNKEILSIVLLVFNVAVAIFFRFSPAKVTILLRNATEMDFFVSLQSQTQRKIESPSPL